MVLKKLFGGKKQASGEEQYTIEDLIVLERYDEAASRLQARVKALPRDLHAHLKLADVYIQLRQLSKAVDEYVYVAEEYAADGFFDKGIALLSKVYKLAPSDENLPLKIEKIKRSKHLERVREMAMAGLREGMGATDSGLGGTSALELQGMWGNLVRSTLVRRLSGEQLQRLFASMRLTHVEAGKVLAEKGSKVPEMFLIVRGTVEATADTAAGARTLIRTFSSGDIIGESSVLEQRAWPAEYTVKEAGTVLSLNRIGLEKTLVGSEDPRGLLEALREQHHDRDVTEFLVKLG